MGMFGAQGAEAGFAILHRNFASPPTTSVPAKQKGKSI
jgi:hypothetical protein